MQSIAAERQWLSLPTMTGWLAGVCCGVLLVGGFLLILGDTQIRSADTEPAVVKVIDLSQAVAGTENFGNLNRLTIQNPDLMVRNAIVPSAADSTTSDGITDFWFLDQSTIRAKSSAYASEPSSTVHPITGLPISPGEVQGAAGSVGGQGVNDYQVYETCCGN
jgi:hypothetical protein